MTGLVNLLMGTSLDETIVRCVALISIIEFVGSIFKLIGSVTSTK